MIPFTVLCPAFFGTHKCARIATSAVDMPEAQLHAPIRPGKPRLDDQSQSSVVRTAEMPT